MSGQADSPMAGYARLGPGPVWVRDNLGHFYRGYLAAGTIFAGYYMVVVDAPGLPPVAQFTAADRLTVRIEEEESP